MKSKIFFFLIAVLCIGMSSCRSQQQYVPMESYEMDSISHNTENLMLHIQNLMTEIRMWEQRRDSISEHDSISIRDSVVLHLNEVGVVISKEHYHDRIQKSDRASFSETNRQTEITRHYIDSILTSQKTELMAMMEKNNQMPVPVERKLTKWEQLKQEIGGVSIGILVVVVMIAVIWLIKKVKNQR